MLVSAVETAANKWQRTKGDPADRMRASRPELYGYLANIGTGVLAEVARQIADSLGSSKKFVDFVVCFMPSPPPDRPPLPYQFFWDETEIRKALRKIYGFRSDALHDGKPFPEPMCEPPFTDRDWAAPSEKSIAIATSARGGVWLAKDAPMLFHFFEYIARNALLKWWREGAPEQS
jgi:hypothetical protein